MKFPVPQPLLEANRFLVRQMFYPLVLSSVLALMTYAGRAVFSGEPIVYFNLVYNLVLAWIPYGFSMLAAWLQRRHPRRWWLLLPPAGLWLLFFPNAPYLVTDFLHLSPRSPIPLWYDILMLAAFSWTGIFLAIVSLQIMHRLVRIHLGQILGWLFAAFSWGLAGLGIYLGRFERWNSWDLLLHPTSVLKDVAVRLVNPFDNIRFFGFTVLVTAFLFVCYLTFLSVRHSDE